MNDPIVDEVRRVRDALAARFDYDLDAIFQVIKKRGKESGLVFVGGVARQPAPIKAVQQTGAAPPVSESSKVAEAAPAAEVDVRPSERASIDDSREAISRRMEGE